MTSKQTRGTKSVTFKNREAMLVVLLHTEKFSLLVEEAG